MSTLRRIMGLMALLLVLILPVRSSRADALVLVHGYLGDANSWFSSGVANGLRRAGWHFGGTLASGRQGVTVRGGEAGDKRFYVMSLPSEAPFEYQLRLLQPMLKAVRKRHPDEPLTLVGHSLGAVLARYAMVVDPDLKVKGLVSIAGPHLGTDKAELGLLAGSTPLSMMAPMIGAGTINRARSLYKELVPAKPGTFLFWLNHQPHPAAMYYSIVRTGGGGASIGDMVVPAYSQDMNNVAALKGRSWVSRSASGHMLERADTAQILEALRHE